MYYIVPLPRVTLFVFRAIRRFSMCVEYGKQKCFGRSRLCLKPHYHHQIYIQTLFVFDFVHCISFVFCFFFVAVDTFRIRCVCVCNGRVRNISITHIYTGHACSHNRYSLQFNVIIATSLALSLSLALFICSFQLLLLSQM